MPKAIEGCVSTRGKLTCQCGATLAYSDTTGNTTIRCPKCHTDCTFPIPVYLARALEIHCTAQARIAEAFLLIAALAAGG